MINIAVLGRTWKVQMLDGDAFLARFKEEASAFTVISTMEIVFAAEEFTLKSVVHELIHAYYDGLCTSSACLNNDQMEEVFCELFAEHGEKLIRQAKWLYAELKDEAA